MGEASLPLPARGRGAARLLPLRTLSDDRLARLAASGDRKAFAAIYERHHQVLYRYCRSILRDDEEARDALQSTMASALRALEGERREISLKPWLFRIAHNESISILRRRRQQADMSEVEELPGKADADLATRARLRELLDDLQQLPERQRGALVMRELSGLEYDEIGEALGVSAQAATQAVYEARQSLLALSEGREMSCDDVRVLISEQDRRRLRGRKVRAHLRSCDACRDFELALGRRPAELGALFPAIPAALAGGLLHGVLGGGGGKGGAGLLASIFGGGGGQAAGTTVAAKAIAVVAITATAGAGAVEVARHEQKPQAAETRVVPVDVVAPIAQQRAASPVVRQGAPGQAVRSGAASPSKRHAAAKRHTSAHRHHGRALGHTKLKQQHAKQHGRGRPAKPEKPAAPRDESSPKPPQPKAKADPPRKPADVPPTTLPGPPPGDALPKAGVPKSRAGSG